MRIVSHVTWTFICIITDRSQGLVVFFLLAILGFSSLWLVTIGVSGVLVFGNKKVFRFLSVDVRDQ